MSLSAGDKLGPYEILAPIGAGGMGEVYKARDTRLDRTVAIKVLPEHIAKREDLRARFEREARAVASLKHPNICVLFDIGSQDGAGYMVMEFMEGETLAVRIGKGALPLDQALKFATQIADALDRAHRAGVTHRDVKPQNIMLTRDGAKVLDFGLAKSIPKVGPTDETLTAVLTTEGTVMGTPQYMAPEQFEGKEADARSDIWAFGAVLYEMVTGQKAFQGKSYSSLLGAILSADPAPMSVKPFTPSWLERLVRRCLAKDPEDRWQTMRDVVIELQTPPQEAAVGPSKAARWPWAVAGLAGALALALAAVSFLHFRETPPAAERMEFQIPIPEGMTLESGDHFILSPDGRKLVFEARGADGVRQLWLRDLSSSETRPLPGSTLDSNNAAFWSADSRYVLFRTNGKLKKIDIRGGSPQTLADVSTALLHGFSTPDGAYVYGVLGKGLFRIPETGGAETQLTRPDPSRRESSHSAPSLLPDGKHFLYLRISSLAENSGLYIGSLAAKPEEQDNKLLLSTAFRSEYHPAAGSGKGQILFFRDGTLFAQMFDPSKLQLEGDPVAVQRDISTFFADALFHAADNGTLIFRKGASQESHPEWFDRAGKSTPALEKADTYIGRAPISPDGANAVFSRLDAQSNQDLWLADLKRSTLTPFASGRFRLEGPVWTPDGSRVIFQHELNGISDLYAKDVSGGEIKPLLESKDYKIPSSVSPDGRFLLFYTRPPGDIWALPLPGGQPFRVTQTDFDERQGSFSPDSKWIAFQSDESGRDEIYVRAFAPPENGAAPSGEKTLVSRGGGTWPRWSTDGKEIFYQSADNKVMSAPVTSGARFQAGEPTALFVLPKTIGSWSPAPDGRRFLVLVGQGETAQAPFTVVLNWQAGLKK